MGTLTADAVELAGHCAHKLPTSCRLTDTLRCCACQDRRPHSSAYSTYGDGVGLTMHGTRWQLYCYFCRDFWANRVAATVPQMQPAQTRIPNVPDQAAFLSRWFDYHRGYKLVTLDGTEVAERVNVSLEVSWRDTDPGHLPLLDESAKRMLLEWDSSSAEHGVPLVSLDATLDELLDDASREAESKTIPRRTQSAHETDHETIEASADDLARMQSLHAAALRTADEDWQSYQASVTSAESAMRAMLGQVYQTRDEEREARAGFNAARNAHRSVTHRQEQRQRTAQRLARVWGTRENTEQQGAEYVSPLTTVFARAYDRYRVAEEVRAEARDEATEEYHQVWSARGTRNWGLRDRTSDQHHARDDEVPLQSLDKADDGRPPPQSDSEMTVNLKCKICLQQRSDTAVLPCGHLVMCSYCAATWAPTKMWDRTQLAEKTQCPLCRESVKRLARIYAV